MPPVYVIKGKRQRLSTPERTQLQQIPKALRLNSSPAFMKDPGKVSLDLKPSEIRTVLEKLKKKTARPGKR